MKTKRTLGRSSVGLAGALCAMLLSACGGNGSSQSTEPVTQVPQVQTGTLGAIPVSGVTYQSETHSGTTDLNGTFQYMPEETVTFTLGSLELGSSDGKPVVTVFDLAQQTGLPTEPEALTAAMWDRSANRPGPMNTVVNLAMLLQGLDADADVSNGIEIPEGLSELIDQTVNLQDFYVDFQIGGNGRDARGTHGLLRAAANEELLSPRPLPNPGLALRRVYDANGVLFVDMQPTLRTVEDSAGVVNSAVSTTFSDAGKPTRIATSQTVNSAPLNISNRTYDDNLVQVYWSFDSNADGTVDSASRIVTDAYGARTLSENIDGAGNTSNTVEYEYDVDGNLIRITHPQYEQIWIVDEQGQRSTAELDRSKDGSLDQRVRVEYASPDSRGDRWIRAEYDNDADGIYDVLRLRSIDEATGQILSNERDDDLDGIFDYVRYQTLNEVGLVVATREDRDGDGVFESDDSFTYNDANLVIEERRLQTNGAIRLQLNSYNENDQLVRVERYDDEASGILSRSTSYTYNENDKLETISSDTDGDGIADNTTSYSYHPDGMVQAEAFDFDNDGIVDETYRYSDWQNVGFGAYF